jgi:hypothetical protein
VERQVQSSDAPTARQLNKQGRVWWSCDLAIASASAKRPALSSASICLILDSSSITGTSDLSLTHVKPRYSQGTFRNGFRRAERVLWLSRGVSSPVRSPLCLPNAGPSRQTQSQIHIAFDRYIVRGVCDSSLCHTCGPEKAFDVRSDGLCFDGIDTERPLRLICSRAIVGPFLSIKVGNAARPRVNGC